MTVAPKNLAVAILALVSMFIFGCEQQPQNQQSDDPLSIEQTQSLLQKSHPNVFLPQATLGQRVKDLNKLGHRVGVRVELDPYLRDRADVGLFDSIEYAELPLETAVAYTIDKTSLHYRVKSGVIEIFTLTDLDELE